jgi:hypothetical protein
MLIYIIISHHYAGTPTIERYVYLFLTRCELGTVQVEPPEDFPLTQMCPGSHLLDFNTWKSLNRIRTGVAPLKTNMVKWGKTNSDDLYCGCGEVQDMGHLLSCRDCPQKCTLEDLWLANKKGFDVAQYWAKNL